MPMLKRWAAWPQSTRWLAGGIAAVVPVLAVAWVLFVPAADWLAHHDVGSAKGAQHETALDNARGRLLTLGAGLFAAGALLFTARNFTLSRRTFELTEQGQVTDRYTKAIEQLGSEKLDVCIGGIYALERVARDSPRDHWTIIEVLTAFVREHSREQWPRPDPSSQEQQRSTRPDVQAAVTVIGRRDAEHDSRPIDLRGADLTGANLGGADLRTALLDGANLGGADLSTAHLTGADLTGADLTDADLTLAYLTDADLTGANLGGAKLTLANLTFANLSGAQLSGAQLSANFHGADLTGVNLHGADLTGVDLTGASWSGDVPVPDGWKLDADSGRLEMAAPDTGPAEAS
jgi:hypothetical protein